VKQRTTRVRTLLELAGCLIWSVLLLLKNYNAAIPSIQGWLPSAWVTASTVNESSFGREVISLLAITGGRFLYKLSQLCRASKYRDWRASKWKKLKSFSFANDEGPSETKTKKLRLSLSATLHISVPARLWMARLTSDANTIETAFKTYLKCVTPRTMIQKYKQLSNGKNLPPFRKSL